MLILYKIESSNSSGQNYVSDKKPCPDSDNLKSQMTIYEEKTNDYGPKVEKLEKYDAQELENIGADEIQDLIQEATDLIKNLDNDNHDLDGIVGDLKNERREFKDGDVYPNHERIEQQIAESDTRLQSLITEFESLKDTLSNTQMQNSKLTHSFSEIEANIIKSSELLQNISNDFNSVTRDINSENMETAKLALIASIIERLAKISEEMAELGRLLDEADEIFKELQSELIELYYIKKLADLKKQIEILLDRLKRLSDLIDKLIELAKALEGHTSDNEEDEFVNDLESELLQVKQQHTMAEDQ